MKKTNGSRSFEELVAGMIACRANAHELLAEADILTENGRHARAYALLHTACEELGKFAMLEIAVTGLLNGRPPTWKRFWQRFRSHESKSAQLEIQLQLLAIPHENPEDFSSLAQMIFDRGLIVRNAALYVDERPDGGELRKPSDINFDTLLPGMRALVVHVLAASDQRGETAGDIQAHLRCAPFDDTQRTVGELFVKMLERARDAGVEKHKIIDLMGKRLN